MAHQRALFFALLITTSATACGEDRPATPPDAAAPDGGLQVSGEDGPSATRDLPPYERPPMAPPPAGHGWTVRDLGDPGATPGRLVLGQSLVLTGGGTDIGGTADSGVFAFRKLKGDGELVTRVRSLQRADAASTAGVMVRADEADPSAASVFFGLLADPARGGQVVHRRARGEASVASAPDPQVRNQFLRVRREGRRFTLSRSSDRIAWVKAGSVEIDMPEEVAFGIALSARTATAQSMAEIDYLKLLGVDGNAPREAWDLEPLGVAAPVLAGALEGDRLTVTAVGDVFTTTWENGAALLAPKTSDTGSLTLTARVDSLGAEQTPNARLALTFREGGPARLSSTSRNILISITAGGRLEFQKRDRSTNFDPGMTRTGIALPVWLRLSRTDDPLTSRSVVTGFYSPDGVAWTVLDAAEFAIPEPIMMGAVYTSGGLTSFGTVRVSQFSVSTVPPPPPPDAGAPDAGVPDAGGSEGGI
jgi:hypothetical protein